MKTSCYCLKPIIALLITSSLILCCCSNKNEKCDDCEALGIVTRTFEEKFPKKTVSVDPLYIKNGKVFKISFSSMEEAEYKITHCLGADKPDYIYSGASYDIIKKVICSDASAMLWPFDSLCKNENLSIVDSDDGLVRIYTWEDVENMGTASNYYEIVQYRWNDKVYVQDESDCDCEYCPASIPLHFYTIKSKNKTYYLVSYYLREWSSMSFRSFQAFELTKKGLKPVDLFYEQNGGIDHLDFEYNIPEWYFTANLGEGYDWLCYYDSVNRVYYHPETEYNLNDRYAKYVFDGEKFVLKDASAANPFLTPSLHEYECLVRLFETKRNKIRIDLMEDETYRYAAWKTSDKMIDDPELVIMNGTFDSDLSRFVFINNGYEYQVFEDFVSVVKDGKQVGKWDVYNRWADE
jgi:hypothetical protein